MPGAATITYGNTNPTVRKPARSVRWAWTSDGSGNVSGIPTAKINGKLRQLVTVPAGGGDAPTAAYDVTILDADGRNVVGTAGADRSATVVEASAELFQVVCDSVLNLVVANAGAAKQGTVILYYE